MRLAAVLPAVALAVDYNPFGDYSVYGGDSARFGTVDAGVASDTSNDRFCHSTKDTLTISRWDVSAVGYFAHYNRIQCQGEEFYCFIEERAHFGQTIGIRAGCAQMMMHPQVKRPSTSAVRERWNNKEALRGRSFTQTPPGAATLLYYGVGGCVAVAAQNGDAQTDSTGADGFNDQIDRNQWPTYKAYSSESLADDINQSQCLRKISTTTTAGANVAALLPFGVSVCRACCVASATVAGSNYSTASGGLCNFLPFSKGTPAADDPYLPTGTNFGCFSGYTQSGSTACAAVDGSCQVCSKEIVPHLHMLTFNTGTSVNLFAGQCSGTTCTPVANHFKAIFAQTG